MPLKMKADCLEVRNFVYLTTTTTTTTTKTTITITNLITDLFQYDGKGTRQRGGQCKRLKLFPDLASVERHHDLNQASYI